MGETLEELLTRIRKDGTLERANEESIKQVVVLPILRHLGWNPEDLHEVYPEFKVEGDRADYCLKHSERELVLIETKRAGEDLGGSCQEQLFRYVFRQGVPLGVLTNGTEWKLYFPLNPGPWKEKVFVIDIAQQESSAASQHFKDFLAKDIVLADKATVKAKEVMDERVRARKTSDVLPRAWAQIWQQPDDLPREFFEAICQRVESICGFPARREQVVEFLAQVKKTLTDPMAPPTKVEEPVHGSKSDSVQLILQDSQWHSAPELRKKLNTQSINPVLYVLEEEGVVELKRSKSGNQVRLKRSNSIAG